MGCIELPAPSWCFEGLQGVLAGPPPPLLPLSPRGSQGCSSHFSPHPLLPGSVLPFLTQTPPRRHHGSCGAGPCPVVAIGAGCNRLCPAAQQPPDRPWAPTTHTPVLLFRVVDSQLYHHPLPNMCPTYLVSKRIQLHTWQRKVSFLMGTLPKDPNLCAIILSLIHFNCIATFLLPQNSYSRSSQYKNK